MKFINGMKDLSQAIVDKTVDVSQKSFKWVKDNRVEIIEYAAITILKSVVEVLNEDRNRKEIYENEYDYNESFESNINESSYISTINDEQVVLKEPQIKNNKKYPQKENLQTVIFAIVKMVKSSFEEERMNKSSNLERCIDL